LDDLKSNPPNMNLYICGSDQIWNPTFTTLGEGKKTTAYYLDFGSTHIKRIAYAASFGCEDLPIDAAIIAKNYLQNFNAISVRENSGLKIVKNLGYSNPVVLCDPTMLLNSDDYTLLLKSKNNTKNKTVFNYFLRGKDERVNALNKLISNDYTLITDRKILSSNSIEDWLCYIKHSSVVVTNSFHGMVLSIMFRTPFIVIEAKGAASAMNDRFRTLLQFLDLQERMIDSIDPVEINELMKAEIDWINVQKKIRILQDNSLSFLEKNISN
jgi:exopolysaccharide biosynthesis predicted pyruvyltransferase EpsI